MIRLLYAIGVLAWFGTGWVLVKTFWLPSPQGRVAAVVRTSTGVGEQVKYFKDGRAVAGDVFSPLVVQAEIFAASGDPPRPYRQSGNLTGRQCDSPLPGPMASLSMPFKVQAISLYPGHPDKSMALISESAGSDAAGKWVKRESRVGVWVVQEIRPGMVVASDGQQVREILVERGLAHRTLVKDVKPGSLQVSSVLKDSISPPTAGEAADVGAEP
jgi:hypothetical protein